MINVENGRVVMSGREDDLMCEATAVLHGLFEQMEKEHGKEEALEKLAEIGRIAVMTQEELSKEVREKLDRLKAFLEEEGAE